MKKRILAAMMAAVMVFSMVGCGSKADEKTDDTAKTEATDNKGSDEEETEIQVFIAASLKNVMDELAAQYNEEHPNVKITYNADSSGTLQTQIEEGSRCDIFFSAATKQMDALTEEGCMKEDSEADLLENKIVAIVPKDSKLELNSFEDLANAETVALGDPDSVPAGQYAKEALTSLNLWDEVSAKASFGTNVTEVLNWVAEGSAEAGVVYATDAAARAEDVEVKAETPEGSLEKPVIYPVGILERTEHSAEAEAFLKFLQSDEAGEIFKEYGFTPYKAAEENETERETDTEETPETATEEVTE